MEKCTQYIERYEMNLSISRINPYGLRILSLRGCTAACTVKVGFERSWGRQSVLSI